MAGESLSRPGTAFGSEGAASAAGPDNGIARTEVRRYVDERVGDMAEALGQGLEDHLSKLHESLEDLRQGVRELQAEAGRRFEHLDERLDIAELRVERRLRELQAPDGAADLPDKARTSPLKHVQQRLDRLFYALHEGLTALEEHGQKLETSLTDRLAGVREMRAQLTEDLRRLAEQARSEQAEQLAAATRRLEEQAGRLYDRVDRVSQQAAELRTRLETGLESLGSELQALRGSLGRTRRWLALASAALVGILGYLASRGG